MHIPGYIGERIFSLYDINCSNQYIQIANFILISCRFFAVSFEAKLKLVFDIFDSNRDGFITGEDIRSVLSHIPLELIVKNLIY